MACTSTGWAANASACSANAASGPEPPPPAYCAHGRLQPPHRGAPRADCRGVQHRTGLGHQRHQGRQLRHHPAVLAVHWLLHLGGHRRWALPAVAHGLAWRAAHGRAGGGGRVRRLRPGPRLGQPADGAPAAVQHEQPARRHRGLPAHVSGTGRLRRLLLHQPRDADQGPAGARRGATPGQRGAAAAAGVAARAAHALQHPRQPARAHRHRSAARHRHARPAQRLPAGHARGLAQRRQWRAAHPARRVRATGRLPRPHGRAHGPAPAREPGPARGAGAPARARAAAAAAGGERHPPRPGAQRARWRAPRERAPRGRHPVPERERQRRRQRAARARGLRPDAGARAPAGPARRRRAPGVAERPGPGHPRAPAASHHAHRMNATALIAEDEPLLAQALQAELARAWPQLRVLATVGDGAAAVEQALALRPEVLFLDIRMPALSGLDAAATLADEWPAEQPLPALVFVTAHDEFAVQAFEAQALDYVLKPVQPERLQRTVARVQAALRARAAPDWAGLRALLSGAASAAPRLRHLMASAGNSVQRIAIDEVLVFEAADKYVRVLTQGREFLIRTPLKELLPQLDPEGFWQIHRGTVVRVDAIDRVTRDEAGKWRLTVRGLDEAFAVSRLYADRFRAM